MSDGPITLVRLPGTYPAQADTWLLADVLRRSGLADGRRVLDLCTGTGALALLAADAGAASVDAVDLSWGSVMSARANSSVRRAGITVHRGDLFGPVSENRFDLVLANPPSVPPHTGRRLVDRICDGVLEVLAPGGMLLLVQSCVTGEQQTLDRLRSAGLEAHVAARAVVPFGPVLRARAALLRARGLLAGDPRGEEVLVVIGSAPGVTELFPSGSMARAEDLPLRQAS